MSPELRRIEMGLLRELRKLESATVTFEALVSVVGDCRDEMTRLRGAIEDHVEAIHAQTTATRDLTRAIERLTSERPT